MPDDGLTIGELGAALGKSISDAQTGLTVGMEVAPRVMAIADATLDLKVSASTSKDGNMKLHTVSPNLIRKGAIEPSALSTISLRFAALGNEPEMQTDPAKNDTPIHTDKAKDVVGQLTKRADVKRLQRILGNVDFQTYPAGADRYRVEMLTDDGRMVREFIVKGSD